MPRPRMKIKTIREILRLDSMSFSTKEIARSVNKGSSSVNDMIRRAREAGVEWSAEQRWNRTSLMSTRSSKKGVTRQLLWEEYLEKGIGSPHYSYPQFCKLYNIWLGKNKTPSMRQVHKAGHTGG